MECLVGFFFFKGRDPHIPIHKQFTCSTQKRSISQIFRQNEVLLAKMVTWTWFQTKILFQSGHHIIFSQELLPWSKDLLWKRIFVRKQHSSYHLPSCHLRQQDVIFIENGRNWPFFFSTTYELFMNWNMWISAFKKKILRDTRLGFVINLIEL